MLVHMANTAEQRISTLSLHLSSQSDEYLFFFFLLELMVTIQEDFDRSVKTRSNFVKCT